MQKGFKKIYILIILVVALCLYVSLYFHNSYTIVVTSKGVAYKLNRNTGTVTMIVYGVEIPVSKKTNISNQKNAATESDLPELDFSEDTQKK